MIQLELFEGFTGHDSKLGLYTSETRNGIPASPGCYAWFLPLWIYTDDFDDLVRAISKILHYDPRSNAHRTVKFSKDQLDLHIVKSVETSVIESHRKTWDELLQSDESRDQVQKVLLETSMFMPPLYVGRTNNLQRRYAEHTGGIQGKNDFFNRFTDYVTKEFFKIEVADLLFVCIRTSHDFASKSNQRDDISDLIEHMLIRLSRPSFSERG